ncbi:hypothetical protein ACGF12_06410 [Kitasatospora sp. NPDC048296]|uniref:hypothetical protein n=1 Tax=Kitasatospora sp. NPDC048296 TaxID=3364048 RepID=UPI00371FC0DE
MATPLGRGCRPAPQGIFSPLSLVGRPCVAVRQCAEFGPASLIEGIEGGVVEFDDGGRRQVVVPVAARHRDRVEVDEAIGEREEAAAFVNPDQRFKGVR